MAICVKEEEKASENCQKGDKEKVDKVELAYWMTVGSLRRFKAVLVGPTQGFPERPRLLRR